MPVSKKRRPSKQTKSAQKRQTQKIKSIAALIAEAERLELDIRKPCRGVNSNICAGEGCFNQSCLSYTEGPSTT